ncbi:MAG: ExbD/TolR family protein [Candidatus Eiseniibacteriota bacterium]
MSSRRSRKLRELITGELDMMPLMNVFLVVIPCLLFSAVFIQVSVIEMNQGTGTGVAEAAIPESAELTIILGTESYLVRARGVEARTVARSEEIDADGNGTGAPAEGTLTELGAVLAECVSAHPDNKEVQIVPEPTTHYDEIIAVMDVARAAGLSQASLAADAPGGR